MAVPAKTGNAHHMITVQEINTSSKSSEVPQYPLPPRILPVQNSYRLNCITARSQRNSHYEDDTVQTIVMSDWDDTLLSGNYDHCRCGVYPGAIDVINYLHTSHRVPMYILTANALPARLQHYMKGSMFGNQRFVLKRGSYWNWIPMITWNRNFKLGMTKFNYMVDIVAKQRTKNTTFIFFGDNSEGDLLSAYFGIQYHQCDYAFIHIVTENPTIKFDKSYRFNSQDKSPLEPVYRYFGNLKQKEKGIYFFTNYGQLCKILYKLGLMSKEIRDQIKTRFLVALAKPNNRDFCQSMNFQKIFTSNYFFHRPNVELINQIAQRIKYLSYD